MTSPDAFDTAVLCPDKGTTRFLGFWVCDLHTGEGWQFIRHAGQLFALRPESRRPSS